MSLREALFIRRQNRFVGTAHLDGKNTTVYIPNTGRLAELLIPNRKVLLAPCAGKHRYKLRYVIYKDNPVFIDSVGTNAVFAELLAEGKVPGLEDFRMVHREVPCGKHRFDFLLENSRGREIYLELKSCTLAWKNVAAFPDAPTVRGLHHLLALRESGRGMVVFFILHQGVRLFTPDYHTHYAFYQTLKECSGEVPVMACAAEYGANYTITGASPSRVLLPEVRPAGSYMLVLKNPVSFVSAVGSLGEVEFVPGYYVYAGSGMGNLFARIGRHLRKRGPTHWHIDYVKGRMELTRDLPIVGTENRECLLAAKMTAMGGAVIPGFGSSDCRCAGHFHYFSHNPMERECFWDLVLEERFGSYTGGDLST